MNFLRLQAEIRVDDDASMELVNEEENTEGDLDTQFHVDVEQELTTMAPAAPSTVGRSSGGSHLNETTPTNDGCRGEEATPPHLGPRCSARRVMQSNLSESLDIHMRVLQCYTHSSCFQSGKLLYSGERDGNLYHDVFSGVPLQASLQLQKPSVCCKPYSRYVSIRSGNIKDVWIWEGGISGRCLYYST